MDIKEKIERFYKRWDFMDDNTEKRKFSEFKIRILNALDSIDDHVSKSSIEYFCIIVGKPQEEYSNIYDTLKKETNIIQFYKLIEIIFSLKIPNEIRYGNRYNHRDTYLAKVYSAFNFSDIDARFLIKDEEVLIIPKGEKQLDDELVNKVLTFLEGSSETHFIESLKLSQTRTQKNRVDSLEKLRRSLEEYLRNKLENRKGLKANITEVSSKLKSLKVNNGIRNMIINTIKSLDQFFNENSKHNDGEISEGENEFMIYQVALIMRYVHTALLENN
jgi:hypothetical protein